MPKLRHIAIAAEDPEAMAEFYKKAFDFEEVGRPNGVLADGVFLIDGTLLPEFDRFGLFLWDDALSRVGKSMARVLSTIPHGASK
jgi:catechol 2,3-dioxygenase-like lactoylglutathione lyase family enzyme